MVKTIEKLIIKHSRIQKVYIGFGKDVQVLTEYTLSKLALKLLMDDIKVVVKDGMVAENQQRFTTCRYCEGTGIGNERGALGLRAFCKQCNGTGNMEDKK